MTPEFNMHEDKPKKSVPERIGAALAYALVGAGLLIIVMLVILAIKMLGMAIIG